VRELLQKASMTSLLLPTGACPCCLARAPELEPARRSRSTLRREVPAALEPTVSPPLCLRGGTIVDPGDGSLRHDTSILVENGRIVSIDAAGSAGSAGEAMNPAARTLDTSGRYIVPGYNDMHCHPLDLDDPSAVFALMLADGVTGFRQMSGSPRLLAARRDGRLPIGPLAPAPLEMPGAVLTPLNAATPDLVRREIALQKSQGADFIKAALVSPDVFRAALIAAQEAGIPILGHLQDGVDAAEASRIGFRTIEHLGPGITVLIGCSSAEDELKAESPKLPLRLPPITVPFLRNLVEWRLRTILINPAAFIDDATVARWQRTLDTFVPDKCDELAARFVADGTWHVPTLVRLRTEELADAPEYATDPFLRYMSKRRIATWRSVTRRFARRSEATRRTYRETYPMQLQLARRLAKAGVRMMTGTDGGWLSAPGLTLHEEFGQLAEAGFSPLEILRMTTTDVADYLGRRDSMGTVEPGRNADLVILDANPLDSVANLSRIAGVVRAGRHHSRQELDALRDRVAAGHGRLT
jgi:imidazolonepropionase-like amidohydrolase